ncbi:hypothetical protein U1Q18_026366 [Sarracenia purpurea var. burkii]
MKTTLNSDGFRLAKKKPVFANQIFIFSSSSFGRPNLRAWLYDDRGRRRRHPVVVLKVEADLEGVVKQASMAQILTTTVDRAGGDGDDGY